MDNVFDIRHSINGDSIVGFTSTKGLEMKGFMDYSTVSSYLMKDGKNSHIKHLGMINLFSGSHGIALPFMKDLFENAAVLECNEGEVLQYDLPVHRGKQKCITMVDTSDVDKPGVDETFFEIVLSREFAKGDILTYDPQFGQQVIVSDQHDVLKEGENYRHFVQFSATGKGKWFPKEKLKQGISYIKIGHSLAEYSTSFSTISMLNRPTGSITCEFHLGGPRGVESFMTAKAGALMDPGMTAIYDETLDALDEALKEMGGASKEMFFMGNVDKAGDLVLNTVRTGATLEYLGLMELQLMEAYSLQFAKAAVLNSPAGIKRVNEGVWHQYRRGKIIEYPNPGGITKDHLQEAASYIWKNSKTPPKKRVLRFKAGWFAYQNLMELFSREAIEQSSMIPSIIPGTDGQAGNKLFSGPLDELEMNVVQFKAVTFPGIGKVEAIYDESLDYMPLSDRYSQGFYGEGKAHTAHSLVIYDAMDKRYSNVQDKVKGASLVDKGDNKANMYYIKPEGATVNYGYTQGRMRDNNSAHNVASSLPYMGKEFWAWNQSAALILDTTRYIVIELARLS